MLTKKEVVGIIYGHQAKGRLAWSLKTKQERQFLKKKRKKETMKR